jgi:hypothetical protein
MIEKELLTFPLEGKGKFIAEMKIFAGIQPPRYEVGWNGSLID